MATAGRPRNSWRVIINKMPSIFVALKEMKAQHSMNLRDDFVCLRLTLAPQVRGNTLFI